MVNPGPLVVFAAVDVAMDLVRLEKNSLESGSVEV
jgi:hypothetical protein